jgi:polyisoprenoid-binding protein YceI
MKNISKTVIGFLMLLVANSSMAQTKKYNWDPVHSNVNYAVDYLKFSESSGRFTKSNGSLQYSKPDFSDAQTSIEIDANSVNSDNADRDGHLKSPDFFDAAKHPTIKFESSSFKKTKDNSYKVNGKLTMKGVTKDIVADATYLGENKDAYGQTHNMWKVAFNVNRQDYGVSFNKNNELGDAVVGDVVKMTINGQFILQK